MSSRGSSEEYSDSDRTTSSGSDSAKITEDEWVDQYVDAENDSQAELQEDYEVYDHPDELKTVGKGWFVLYTPRSGRSTLLLFSPCHL